MPVGVDVETAPPERPLPLNLLHPRERNALEALAAPDCDLAFLRFWTAREACAKATGRGLPARLSSIEARDALDDHAVVLLEHGIVVGRAQITMREDAVAAVVELAGSD
jgi:phosphopantetheinyl transferase